MSYPSCIQLSFRLQSCQKQNSLELEKVKATKDLGAFPTNHLRMLRPFFRTFHTIPKLFFFFFLWYSVFIRKIPRQSLRYSTITKRIWIDVHSTQ